MKKSVSQLNAAGKKYFERGQISEAIKSFKEALELDPKFYEGWFNLGLIYQKQNCLKEAIDCYNNNIKFYAQNPFALKNLALCYSLIGEAKKAHEIAKLLIGKGHDWESYFNLATTAQIAGETLEGIKNYKKSMQLNPNFLLTYGRLYNLYERICDWASAKKLIPKVSLLGAELPYGSISRLQNASVNLEVAKLKAQDIEEKSKIHKVRFVHDKKDMKKKKKIRIGYLSSDFHDHATVHLILGLLKNHNKDDFEIVAYSHGVYDESDYRKNVISAVTAFRDISSQNDREAAVTIYGDSIDILVDLKGYTNGNRLGIMALKPAPVSVTWLGFPGSLGGNFIDYIIADKVVIPENEKKYFSEKVLYMPNSYQVNDNTQKISDKKYTRKELGLPLKSVVFASFNQAYKISPETFASWMNILKAVPGSVLWLYEKLDLASENLKKEAKKAGIDPARLVFAGNLPKDEHLARIKLTDLALDTFTYNGHTTTSDCLWAGVPVITLKGNHFASRVSASLLTAISLPELITHSPKEYEALAVKLATKPYTLNAIRLKLSANRLTKPLFDTQKFTRDLESIYKKIYRDYLTSRKI